MQESVDLLQECVIVRKKKEQMRQYGNNLFVFKKGKQKTFTKRMKKIQSKDQVKGIK